MTTSPSAAVTAARRVPGMWSEMHTTPGYLPQRGDFDILDDDAGPRSIAVCCPGCGAVSLLSLRSIAPPGSVGPDWWRFDGDREAPTLYPSIHHLGCWHGWLSDGLFVPC